MQQYKFFGEVRSGQGPGNLLVLYKAIPKLDISMDNFCNLPRTFGRVKDVTQTTGLSWAQRGSCARLHF